MSTAQVPNTTISISKEVNTQEKISNTRTAELIIGLCGPIGSPIHDVAKNITHLLTNVYQYETKTIKLSDFIEKYKQPVDKDPFKRIKDLIRMGNELRKDHQLSILADLAISEIGLEREKSRKSSTDPFRTRRKAYIIDSIKNNEELNAFRAVYGDLFYFIGVSAPVETRVKNLEAKEMKTHQVYELIDQDSGEELEYGQTVKDTFPQSDFFLRIAPENERFIQEKLQRFLDIIFESKIITPTIEETAMYHASSAAGSSACLSRQVGASLTDKDGNILSIGWNDVPKAGGGLYMANTSNEKLDDFRCMFKEGGICSNDKEKRNLTDLLISELENDGVLNDKTKAIQLIKENKKIKSLIEFSRSVHAEMHAIILGSQNGGSRVIGGKLFCTTYPCHSCARHIVVAGIKEVYYIEPYKKSLATKLHSDSLTENEKDLSKVRILMFDGVSPTRYMSFFKKRTERKDKEGKRIPISFSEITPKHTVTLEAIPTLEGLVIEGLKRRSIIS